MIDLALALRAFIRTVERGSVTAAARDLGVSQPAVTKHLRNLERHIGARLLERSSRAVVPTGQGQALYDASRPAMATIDAAVEGIKRDMGSVEGLLRVHAPTCIGSRRLPEMMMAFQTRYPAVTVDLVLENRVVDVVFENFDVALRYGRPEQQDLVIRRIGLVRRIFVASPAFLARFGSIAEPGDLSGLPLVLTPMVPAPRDVLTLQGPDGTTDVPVRPVMRTNSAEVIWASLMSGHAAGPVQELLVADDLAAGRLVRILPEWEVRPTEAFLAYPSVRFMRPVVRAFTDFSIAALRASPGIVEAVELGRAA